MYQLFQNEEPFSSNEICFSQRRGKLLKFLFYTSVYKTDLFTSGREKCSKNKKIIKQKKPCYLFFHFSVFSGCILIRINI